MAKKVITDDSELRGTLLSLDELIHKECLHELIYFVTHFIFIFFLNKFLKRMNNSI